MVTVVADQAAVLSKVFIMTRSCGDKYSGAQGMKKVILTIMMVFTLLCVSLSGAEPVPSSINYQGYLGNPMGNPLPDGNYSMVFRLFETVVGGEALWTENREGSVSVVNGRFNVSLGSVALFEDAGIGFNQGLFLEIEVVPYGPLEPRLAFVSAPYANRAQNIDAMGSLSGAVVGTSDAQTLTGKTISNSVVNDATIDNTAIGATTPAEASFTTLTASGDLTVEGMIFSRVLIEGTPKTTSYTLTESDHIILVDTTAGEVEITPPAAAANLGRSYIIKLKTLGFITPTSPWALIVNTAPPRQLNREGQAVRIVSDGSNWQVVDQVADAELGWHFIDGNDNNLSVLGSECVGFDCVNGEGFGMDTLRTKENNTRIYFWDTSSDDDYPTSNWQLTANDSSNGGKSYFSIDEMDTDTRRLLVEAGGNVGMGTVDEVQGTLDVPARSTAGTGTVSTQAITGTGTITVAETPASGTISVSELAGTGTIDSMGTSVTGTGTVFTTELLVGNQISAGGEIKTVSSIVSDGELTVDSVWISDLAGASFTYPGVAITGKGTSFTNELAVGVEIRSGGETRTISSITSDLVLEVDMRWLTFLTDDSFGRPGTTVTGDGTQFSSEVGVGVDIRVGEETNTIVIIDTMFPLQLSVDQPWHAFHENEIFTYPDKVLLGTGTSFTTDVTVGDLISVAGVPGHVTDIVSDTELEVDRKYPVFISDAVYHPMASGFLVTVDGKTGIGTATPDEAFEIEFAATETDAVDVEMGQGADLPTVTFVNLRSPNKSQFFITVDDSGNLTTLSVKP
jgi:hypothetical protein